MSSFTSITLPVHSKDERFFKELGARIAQARKDQGLTQTQLADELGIAQQTLAHYEVGRLRAPASLLPTAARTLNLAVEELLGQPVKASSKRGPAPRLQQQIERIAQLPRARQQVVMDMLDGALAQRSR